MRALAKAGVAGLVPILRASASGSPQGAAAQASPGRPATLADIRSDDPAGPSPDRPSIRVVLPGPDDTVLWAPAPAARSRPSFIPTPGSPVGPRAARLAERLERGHRDAAA